MVCKRQHFQEDNFKYLHFKFTLQEPQLKKTSKSDKEIEKNANDRYKYE